MTAILQTDCDESVTDFFLFCVIYIEKTLKYVSFAKLKPFLNNPKTSIQLKKDYYANVNSPLQSPENQENQTLYPRQNCLL